MGSRILVRNKLSSIDKKAKLYFQPPSNQLMEYPCIRYELKTKIPTYADNKKYLINDVYNCLYISNKYDEDIIDNIIDIDGATFDRVYRADNLYHISFNITIQSLKYKKEDKYV